MQRTTYVLLALAAAAASSDLLAQSNSRNTGAVPLSNGYNGALSSISSARAWGRRGTGPNAYPNGELGVSFQNDLCNPGGFNLAWAAANNSPPGTQMSQDHPKFGFLVAKEQNGRLVQISDWSYCKHAFLSTNTNGSCGTCQNNAFAETMYVGCSDVYSNSNNGDRVYLGPPGEINPWLGSWNHVGSFFDAGLPAGGNMTDGIKNSINPGTDAVVNRVTIKELDVQGGLSTGLYFQIHVIHEGEPIENRGDNTMSRPFGLGWNGTSWSASTSGTPTHGSILTRWTGSTMAIGQNGGGAWNNTDDGRIAVAVKVTGPVNGMWHYEYVVHNIDSDRGSSAFRLPVCSSARVENLGFRDIDQNALNQWTATVGGGEIAWTAPPGNPQNWNTLFNFWFDSDAAPIGGNATLDAARVGPGALTVTVPTSTPGFVPVIHLAGGCGTPAALLTGFGGLPTASNPNFGLRLTSDPGTFSILYFSGPTPGVNVAPGCDLFIDVLGYGDIGGGNADPSGVFEWITGVDPSWGDINLQALTLFIPVAPIFGFIGLSNGVTVRFNGSGCP